MNKPRSTPVRTSLRQATEAFKSRYTGSDAEAYAESRGIGPEAAAQHALGHVPKDPTGIDVPEGFARFAGRLAIPNLNFNRDPVMLKFRHIGSEDTDRKYDGPVLSQRLFNLQALRRATDTLVLCEGELEAVTWTHLNVPAVAIPGATNWKPHHRLLFEGIPRVVFVADDDEAGDRLMEQVVKDLEKNDSTGVVAVTVPGDFNDANEALVAGYGNDLVALVEGAGR